MEKTWKVVLAFVVIFMAGTVTGSIIALRVAHSLMPRPYQPGAVVEQFGMMQFQRLETRLELTDAQKEKLRPIVQKTGEDLRRLSRDSQRETHDVMARMDDQVSALLTPEQQKKFVEVQKRRNQEFQKRGYRGGPGGGGPGSMGGWPQGQRQPHPGPPEDAIPASPADVTK